MDTLTFLMLMMLVVLVVIVIQLRRGAGGGTCKCPVDEQWKREFERWAEAEYVWAEQVQKWIDGYNDCLSEMCTKAMAKEDPPKPPPCKFGSC